MDTQAKDNAEEIEADAEAEAVELFRSNKSKGPVYLVWNSAANIPDVIPCGPQRRYTRISRPGDHFRNAWIFMRKKCSYKKYKKTVVYHKGLFHIWEGKGYVQATPDHEKLIQLAHEFLTECKMFKKDDEALEDVSASNSNAKGIVDAVKSLTLLSDDFQQPCWISDEYNDIDPTKVIMCQNGIYDLSNNTLIPHTPDLFSNNAIAVNYSPDAPSPKRWLSFLDEVFKGDVESIELLQQWFGYCMTQDTSHHKILSILGPTRSGKSTIVTILERLVGKAATSSNFTEIAGTFGLSNLVDKSLVTFPDARVGYSTDKAKVQGILLQISGEDIVPINIKNKHAFSTKLNARIVITSNDSDTIAFNDTSGAFQSRLLYLQCMQSFKGREDRALVRKLLSELPGILNWSIRGWEKLQKVGRFVEPKICEGIRRDYSSQVNPVEKFFETCCEFRKGSAIHLRTLHEAYKIYESDQRITNRTFGRMFSNFIRNYSITTNNDVIGPKNVNIDGTKLKGYENITINSEWLDSVQDDISFDFRQRRLPLN